MGDERALWRWPWDWASVWSAVGSAFGGSGVSIREGTVSEPARSPGSSAHDLLAGDGDVGPQRGVAWCIGGGGLRGHGGGVGGGGSGDIGGGGVERVHGCGRDGSGGPSRDRGPVWELIKLGMIDAVEPQGLRCPEFEVTKANRNHFGGSGRDVPAKPLPWARLECDLYGPIKCGNRNGPGFLFAITCLSAGVVFVQPARAKSEAVAGLRAFAKWFGLWAPATVAALWMFQGSLMLGELRCHRGGEFTFTWTSRR